VGQIVTVFLRIAGLLILLGFGSFSVISIMEKEKRAARVAILCALLGGAVFFGISAMPENFQISFSVLIITIALLGIILFFLPIGKAEPSISAPNKRFDEREIMFVRYDLEPGSPEYKEYYEMHPEHELEDNLTREKPGLSSPDAKFANPYQFAALDAGFFLTHAMRSAVDGPVADNINTLPPDEMTAYLKRLAIYFGAVDVGVTELQPYHVYSHVGRGEGVYGEEIPLEHKYAIAFTVEMAHDMVGTGPHPPTSMETCKQYVESARVAIQLASTIRNLGYPARAHIDRNYRVIAPLVARDAGLGEIGRMTILMTPKLGPRVRIGVVTTNIELIPSIRKPDPALIDFCNICEKCAHTCPSNSIPFGPQEEEDGVVRWILNPDSCFRYWNIAGTDCSRCMMVCPFSHPDNFSHNFIRWGINKSGSFRRAALWMDDLFYGGKPEKRETPAWVDVPKQEK